VSVTQAAYLGYVIKAISQRTDELLAFAKGDRIESGEISQQALAIERGKVSARDQVTSVAPGSKCLRETAELSGTAREYHRQPGDLWVEGNHLLHSKWDFAFSIERNDLYLVTAVFK
jgi:hypothetical protein